MNQRLSKWVVYNFDKIACACPQFKPSYLIGLWLFFSVVMILFVISFTRNIPYGDEWSAIVPFLTGDSAYTWRELTAQHNEHQIILTRIGLLLTLWLTNYDFRIAPFLNLTALFVIAGLCQWALYHVRGRWSWVDTLPPLLFLNLGHFENLLTGFQLQFMLTSLGAIILMCLFLKYPSPTNWNLFFVSVILLLLPMTTAGGVIISMFGTLWVINIGLQRIARSKLETEDIKSISMVDKTLPFIIPLVVLAVCAWAFPRSTHTATGDRSLPTMFLSSIKVFSNATGLAAPTFPFQLGFLVLSGAIAAIAATTSKILRHWLDTAPHFGLAVLLMAFIAIGIGIVIGRQGLSAQALFGCRYYTMFAPMLVIILVLSIMCIPNRWPLIIGSVYVLVQLLLWTPHAWAGHRVAKLWHDPYLSMKSDLRSGKSLKYVSEHYAKRVSGMQHTPEKTFFESSRKLITSPVSGFAGVDARHIIIHEPDETP